MFSKEKHLVSLILLEIERTGNFSENDTYNIKEDLANINSIEQFANMVLKIKVYFNLYLYIYNIKFRKHTQIKCILEFSSTRILILLSTNKAICKVNKYQINLSNVKFYVLKYIP